MTEHIEMNGIDHYAIHVRDLVQSAGWYERVLGFRVLHKWTTTWMVGRGNIRVGLFQRPDAQPLPDPEQLLLISHIAFAIDGDKFEAARRALIDAGVEVEGPDDSGIAHSLFFKDPDGHELELTTYHPIDAEDH
jgi:catechol-2,3-dioxygenase